MTPKESGIEPACGVGKDSCENPSSSKDLGEMKTAYCAAIQEAVELHERACDACAAAQWAEATEAGQRALSIFENEDGLESPDVANLCNLLSEAAQAQGQYATAEAHARRAWVVMEKLTGRCQGPEADAIRGQALGRLGVALRAAGRYKEAGSWLVRALEYAESTGQGLPAALNDLGLLYQHTGNFAECEQLFRRALALVPEGSAEAATLHHNLAQLAHARGRFAEGEADARRAWEIRRELRGTNHPETLEDGCAYAALLDGLGRYEDAERIYRYALARFEQVFGGKHVAIAEALHDLAGVRRAQGDANEAEALYRRAAVMRGELLGVSHPDTAATLHHYAAMLAEQGRTEDARQLESRALAVWERTLDSFHPQRIAARELWETLNK